MRIEAAVVGPAVFLDFLGLPREVRTFPALEPVRFWCCKFGNIVDGWQWELKPNQPILILYHSGAPSDSSSKLLPLLYRDVAVSLPQVSQDLLG